MTNKCRQLTQLPRHRYTAKIIMIITNTGTTTPRATWAAVQSAFGFLAARGMECTDIRSV